MIEAIELSKRYEDDTLALDSLDLKVDEGQVYCLLGANGAGKTTTMNLLLGFISPTSGQARLDGFDVEREPLEAKRHVAYLDESVKLYGNLTAIENLRFFAGLTAEFPVSPSAARLALIEAGLESEAATRRVHHFSKGMRQKVGIAVAVARRARILLLDEPSSGLDPQATAELLDTLRRQRDRGCAVLMNTHDVYRARELADRVGIMRGGHLVAELESEEFRRENLERIYLDLQASRDERGTAAI